MWIYSTSNEMVNLNHAERIELRQVTNLVVKLDNAVQKGDQLTGVSIVAHMTDNTEVQLVFVQATASNYDIVVTRYWNAIRTAIKAKADVCDLMDIA